MPKIADIKTGSNVLLKYSRPLVTKSEVKDGVQETSCSSFADRK